MHCSSSNCGHCTLGGKNSIFAGDSFECPKKCLLETEGVWGDDRQGFERELDIVITPGYYLWGLPTSRNAADEPTRICIRENCGSANRGEAKPRKETAQEAVSTDGTEGRAFLFQKRRQIDGEAPPQYRAAGVSPASQNSGAHHWNTAGIPLEYHWNTAAAQAAEFGMGPHNA